MNSIWLVLMSLKLLYFNINDRTAKSSVLEQNSYYLIAIPTPYEAERNRSGEIGKQGGGGGKGGRGGRRSEGEGGGALNLSLSETQGLQSGEGNPLCDFVCVLARSLRRSLV